MKNIIIYQLASDFLLGSKRNWYTVQVKLMDSVSLFLLLIESGDESFAGIRNQNSKMTKNKP